jgi:TetR/AcrR family transcriptional repressor of nem operon
MTLDTKTALLDSAEAAARRLGFDGFSYADLAADVGIRKASIHYHFPTKADLSEALVSRYTEGFRTVCAQIDETEDTGAGRLRALIDRYSEALQGGQSLCLCVAFSISRDNLSEGTRQHMAQFRAMMIGWIERAFEAGQADGSITGVTDPKVEALAVLPLLEGAQLTARACGDASKFYEAIEILRGRLT